MKTNRRKHNPSQVLLFAIFTLASNLVFAGTEDGSVQSIDATTKLTVTAYKTDIVLGAHYAAPQFYGTLMFANAKNAVAKLLGKHPDELGTDDQVAQLIRNLAGFVDNARE